MTSRLGYRLPYQWQAMLGFLRRRSIEAVELCDQNRYRRTFDTHGHDGIVTIAADPMDDAIDVSARGGGSHAVTAIEKRVRSMLDLDADMASVEAVLEAANLPPPLTVEMSGVRVPGAWHPFELGVRAILGQQITVKAARTLAGRLCERFGRRVDAGGVAAKDPSRVFPSADALAEADVGVIGVTKRRAGTVRAFARAVADKRIDLDPGTDLDEVESQLLALPGIGKWTAGYMRMRAFEDRDAFPHGDVALVKAAQLLGIASNAVDLERASQRWRPWRAYVAVRLWRSLSGLASTRKATTGGSQHQEG